MPGPARWMGEKILSRDKDINEDVMNDQARRLFRTMFRTNAFEASRGKERSEDRPEDRRLIRDAGAEAIVLLKNEDKILPIDPSRIIKLAVDWPAGRPGQFPGRRKLSGCSPLPGLTPGSFE